ncbi:hypothetical protein SERLA73DRAFT_58448, partial [Serpula lacrymans var. lacrymans S7.3]
FGMTYVKIGMIQRRLAWPLHKDDTLFRSGRPTGLNIYFVCKTFKGPVWPWCSLSSHHYFCAFTTATSNSPQCFIPLVKIISWSI